MMECSCFCCARCCFHRARTGMHESARRSAADLLASCSKRLEISLSTCAWHVVISCAAILRRARKPRISPSTPPGMASSSGVRHNGHEWSLPAMSASATQMGWKRCPQDVVTTSRSLPRGSRQTAQSPSQRRSHRPESWSWKAMLLTSFFSCLYRSIVRRIRWSATFSAMSLRFPPNFILNLRVSLLPHARSLARALQAGDSSQ
mmetsp:Transcript_21816/g.52474  ORF Transcript_21816/g.52474 Transcript_21816/m.52474 type:complete len:204 (-) Transcript_21816:78-689(-)